MNRLGLAIVFAFTMAAARVHAAEETPAPQKLPIDAGMVAGALASRALVLAGAGMPVALLVGLFVRMPPEQWAGRDRDLSGDGKR